ncbi:MAG: hypothetical protein HQK55_06150 [Deltaproteobacteria bacterium]|nr:hypothetical protein [Deltaproteobacteria bacterium]
MDLEPRNTIGPATGPQTGKDQKPEPTAKQKQSGKSKPWPAIKTITMHEHIMLAMLKHIQDLQLEDELEDRSPERIFGSGSEEDDYEDEPDTDFDGYDADDNPLLDEDSPGHLLEERPVTIWDQETVEDPLSTIPEKPAIILELDGDGLEVVIPAEEYRSMISSLNTLPPWVGDSGFKYNFMTIRLKFLRTIGEAVVRANEELLINSPEDSRDIAPGIKKIRQVDIASEVEDKVPKKIKGYLSHLIHGQFIQVPGHGVLSLERFFVTSEETKKTQKRITEKTFQYLHEALGRELLDDPLSDERLLNKAKDLAKEAGDPDKNEIILKMENARNDGHKSLRTWLKEMGVPLEIGRRHLFEKVKLVIEENKEKNKNESISWPNPLSLLDTLIKDYGLFAGSSRGRQPLGQYREERYRDFVIARLRQILEALGVEEGWGNL